MTEFDVTTADKDQLVKYAKDTYQVTIDPRTKIETIRTRVENLIAGKEDEAPVDEAVTTKAVQSGPRWVKSSVNGNVYEWHPELEGCDWLTPCDADGNTV